LGSVWDTIQGRDEPISTSAVDKAAHCIHEQKAIGLISSMVINTLKVELDELPETKWEVTTGTGDTT
jgi:hypothetical protein